MHLRQVFKINAKITRLKLYGEKLLYSCRAVRMCVGCRGRFLQSQLLRLVYNEGKVAQFAGVGRSFYFCQECLKDEKKIMIGLSRFTKSKHKNQDIKDIQEIANKWKKK